MQSAVRTSNCTAKMHVKVGAYYIIIDKILIKGSRKKKQYGMNFMSRRACIFCLHLHSVKCKN